MKHPITLTLCVLAAISIHAQTTFERYYEAVGTSKVSIMELSSGNYLVGIAWESGTSLLDQQGNILHTHCYLSPPDTALLLEAVGQASDNEYYFVTGYMKDTCSTGSSFGYPLIGKMDSLGSVSILHYYPLNATQCSNSLGNLEVVSNKAVVAWGRNTPLHLLVLKADSNLTHVWSRRFNQSGTFHFFRELPGGDLLGGFDMGSGGAGLVRLDADGGLLWSKSYFQDDGRMHDAVIESDSTFLAVGYSGPPANKVFLMKVDGQGGILWSRGYHTSKAWNTVAPRVRIRKTLDGNYVLLASTGSMVGRTGRAMLWKTDGNGDTLWVRRYGVEGAGYDVADLLATSDGGFVFDGQGYPHGMYIFKTDSLGHIPCSGAPSIPFYITDLFPVDSTITLTSTDSGTTMTGYITDAIHDPIVTHDGCTVTGMEHLSEPARSHTIRPNPTTGRFTLGFPDPLTADSFYSVYDAMGRLLFQRPLHAGQQREEIDLSRFGRGTYVVRIIGKDGVSNGRVVVQ